MIKQNRNIELTPVSPEPLEHIIKFNVQTSKFNVIKNYISLVKERWADTLRQLQPGTKSMPATWQKPMPAIWL